MRKDNYLVAMLNVGVLSLTVPFRPFPRRPLITQTLVWSLFSTILDPAFDPHSFRLRREALDPPALRRRMRAAAALSLFLSPFVAVYLLMYHFLGNAERFYHHPSSAGERTWVSCGWREACGICDWPHIPMLLRHIAGTSPCPFVP